MDRTSFDMMYFIKAIFKTWLYEKINKMDQLLKDQIKEKYVGLGMIYEIYKHVQYKYTTDNTMATNFEI